MLRQICRWVRSIKEIISFLFTNFLHTIQPQLTRGQYPNLLGENASRKYST